MSPSEDLDQPAHSLGAFWIAKNANCIPFGQQRLSSDYIRVSRYIFSRCGLLSSTLSHVFSRDEKNCVSHYKQVKPTGDQEVAGSTPAGPATYFVEADHKIFSTVILSLPLIQERQLSFSCKRMRTKLVNHLENYM